MMARGPARWSSLSKQARTSASDAARSVFRRAPVRPPRASARAWSSEHFPRSSHNTGEYTFPAHHRNRIPDVLVDKIRRIMPPDFIHQPLFDRLIHPTARMPLWGSDHQDTALRRAGLLNDISDRPVDPGPHVPGGKAGCSYRTSLRTLTRIRGRDWRDSARIDFHPHRLFDRMHVGRRGADPQP
jgi:hypothetical protein